MRATEVHFIFLLLVASTFANNAAERNPVGVCFQPPGGQKPPTTAFQQSLKNVLQSLQANVSLTGFATATSGRAPDQLYGRALCYGDVSAEDCKGCISNATSFVNPPCETSGIWFDQCMMQLASWNFIGILDTQNKTSNANTVTVPDIDLFNQKLSLLLNNLTWMVVSNRSRLMFATGDIGYTGSLTIHGLVQCTRDISVADCGLCLGNLTEIIPEWGNGKSDVIISAWSCVLRYRVPQLFSNAAETHSHRLRRALLMATASIFSAAALLV